MNSAGTEWAPTLSMSWHDTSVLFFSAAAAGASPLRPDIYEVRYRLRVAGDAHMVTVKDKDVSGQVFKRLGLPNQDYCWQQCLLEDRCTGSRWGFIAGATAGQCQLMSGALTFGELHEIKTEDGQRILVIASSKEAGASKSGAGKSGA